MKAMDLNIGTLHFVGIGGIGMSGIAEVLNNLGYTIQGSDIKESANVERLREQGIDVKIGHDGAHVKGVACVVISSAVKGDNPELKAARAAKIPVVRRAEMLAELMRMKFTIALGGTHGKTTTTAMVGQMLEAAGLDPTVINGGIVNSYGTNTRLGKSEWMVVEADESDGTFTKLPASVVAVTNIDPEHMEHYGSFDVLKEAFKTFITNIPFYGYAVMCIDHPEVQALIPEITDRKIITYGFSPQADIRAENLRTDPSGTTFDVIFANDDTTLKDIFLPMLGRHNVQNSLIALAVAQQMDIAPPLMKKGMEGFTGVKRRFTKTGEVNNVTIIDDYAHHPVEIATILETARTAVKDTGGNVIAVMQPHRYSRLHDLFEDFCTCFNEADSVIITDIYEAGETPIEGASQQALVEGIKQRGHKDVEALDARENLAKIIHGKAKLGDFVICMGAGDITAWAYELPGELQVLSESNAA
ncbi:UDP-N-acetylmuramate--L-alanine ligase [Alphaproteobacteria bacterium]|nr:UDP-N-acetylmuramate--L-alanine ligase [Alphaproteobacteria bacterium]